MSWRQTSGGSTPNSPTQVTLLGIVWAGILLVLLTPFVISGETVFPFVVGRVLYFRSLVEIVFVAWTTLAVLNPDYRPRWSCLLFLLALALGVAVLSACLGVSAERSFWSTYERMRGVVDQAHWFALALVLVSVVRPAQWTILLNVNLAIGGVVAVWAVGQYLDVQMLLWDWSTAGYGRVVARLGNPIQLGAYLLVNCLVAAGFLARSLVSPATARARPDGGAKQSHGLPASRVARWVPRLFWTASVLLNGWVVTLTASRAAFLGLVVGFAATAALFAFVERRRLRLAAAGTAAVLATSVVVLVVVVISFEPERGGQRPSFSNPLAERLTSGSKRTVGTRLAAWQAAFDGFLERPVLGWGPENYIAVLGSHASGVGADMRAHDNAHGKLAEELATRGGLGAASLLAIWLGLLVVGLRRARSMETGQRVLLLFVGGALAGHIAQGLISPDTATTSLQFTLLFAFVAVADLRSEHPAHGRKLPRAAARALGGAALTTAMACSALGLNANYATYGAAKAGALAMRSSAPELGIAPRVTRLYFADAIDGFRPMATQFRLFLFQYGTHRWRFLRATHRVEAVRLLELVEVEAPRAAVSESANWEIPANLAALYRAVGATNPEYRDTAARYLAAAVDLAPNRQEVRELLAPRNTAAAASDAG